MTDGSDTALEQLREIIERRREGPSAFRADDTLATITALRAIREHRDARALPWLLELWCSRPPSRLVLDELRAIGTLWIEEPWAPAVELGEALCAPSSHVRFGPALAPGLLDDPVGVAFAQRLLGAFSYVARPAPDASTEERVFTHPGVADVLGRSEWIELLESVRDHDDLRDAADHALGAAPVGLARPPRAAARRAAPRGDALSRYRAGDHEAAWRSMVELGPLGDDARDEARAVATEMMQIVRANAELLIVVLDEAGYPFAREPLEDPARNEAPLERLRQIAGGPPPVSLEVFWRVVGGIDLCRDEQGPDCDLDADHEDILFRNPLQIGSLADCWYSVEEWLERRRAKPLEIAISADELHKEWTSGGPPYAMRVPSALADGRVLYEPHGLELVPYLRANFAHGGFLGYEHETHSEPYRRLLARVESQLMPF